MIIYKGYKIEFAIDPYTWALPLGLAYEEGWFVFQIFCLSLTYDGNKKT